MPVLAPLSTAFAPDGMVCAVDHLAAGAGALMFRRGGTAADAAVAASAVLAVTTPHMCGTGGDLFALVHERGAPAALNASGRAGSGADPERLRAEGAAAMPFRGDIRSVPVPGCVDGWLALHERFGRLPLADVLAPAVRYAESGFPASPLLAGAAPLVAGVAGGGEIARDGGLRPGQRVRRPLLGAALGAIAGGGRDAWYGGAFGEGLLALGGGEYDPADLDRPLADWVEPLSVRVWGHDVWTVPPNSQGYLSLAGAWIAAGLPLPDDPDDAGWVHLLVEAAKQAGFDRVDVLYEGADGAALLDPGRLGPRRDAIDPARAAALPARYRDGGTIHLAAAGGGMAVSLIQSNASGFGAHLAVAATETFLHNRGIGFSLVPGHPAEYGPGRRPPHTLAPALVTRPDGSFAAVVGTMGGDSQPQVVLQLLTRLFRHGQTPARAVAAPRFTLASDDPIGFDTWVDPSRVGVRVEGHAPPGWTEGLLARGHRVDALEAFSTAAGHAHVIVDHGDGVLAGATDPRALTGGVATV